MKALLVARKSLIEILREPQLLLLVLLLPVVFVAITAFVYNVPLLTTYPVQVISPNQDEPLIEELKAARYAGGRPIFDVTVTTDQDAAETALEDRDITAAVAITPDGAEGQTRVTIWGDPLYLRFHRAQTMLKSVITRYADRISGRPEVVRLVEQSVFATGPSASLRAGPQTELDLYAPGMMVMALLMIIPQTAMLVAREIRWHTLRRLRLTRLRALDLLGGVSLSQMVVALAQVVIVFLAALALGFHNQGSLLLAVLVGLVISFSAIGQGLVVACFVENDSQALNVGSTATMIQVFVSGSFYQFPPLTLFTLAGHQIDLFDVFPATHGFMALQQVLTYGAGLREVAFRLGATLLLSVLYFLAGVVIFQRLQMRDRV
jgi:ABC-2 type transport system permease protein